MAHREIYELFKMLFPMYEYNVTEWFPNGKGSIRVRLEKNMDFIFSYKNNKDWKFETVNSFLAAGMRK